MAKPRKAAAAQQPKLKNLAPKQQPRGGRQKLFSAATYQFKTGGLP